MTPGLACQIVGSGTGSTITIGSTIGERNPIRTLVNVDDFGRGPTRFVLELALGGTRHVLALFGLGGEDFKSMPYDCEKSLLNPYHHLSGALTELRIEKLSRAFS